MRLIVREVFAVSVLLIMIPAALVLAAIGVIGFVLAVKSGQFDDLDTPALRAVFDDDDTLPTKAHEMRGDKADVQEEVQ